MHYKPSHIPLCHLTPIEQNNFQLFGQHFSMTLIHVLCRKMQPNCVPTWGRILKRCILARRQASLLDEHVEDQLFFLGGKFT